MWGSVDVDGSAARVALRGELDLATSGQVEVALATLLGGGCTTIVVDLGGLRLLDCAGLRPLHRTARAAAAAGGSFRVERPTKMVRMVLRLTGSGHLLTGRRKHATP